MLDCDVIVATIRTQKLDRIKKRLAGSKHYEISLLFVFVIFTIKLSGQQVFVLNRKNRFQNS